MDGPRWLILQTLVSQAYARSDDFIPQYTALHPNLGSSDGGEMLHENLPACFPCTIVQVRGRKVERRLGRDKAEVAAVPYRFRDFWDRYKAEPFLGRDEHLREALSWVESHDSGVALILGRPGMGKTAFAVHLSNTLKARHPDWLCLRHFFKADDPRCSRRAFLCGVLYQLAAAKLPTGAEAGERTLADPAKLDDRELAEQFLAALNRLSRDHLTQTSTSSETWCTRLVLLLDGLDNWSNSTARSSSCSERRPSRRCSGCVWGVRNRPCWQTFPKKRLRG